MAGYPLFEIQLDKNYGEEEFKAELQHIYRDYLAPPTYTDQQMVFLFTDQHVANESFLEYINSILTTGIVPALFTDDDKDKFTRAIHDLAVK